MIFGLGLFFVFLDIFVSLCFVKVILLCFGLWDSFFYVSFLFLMGGGVGGLFDFGCWNRLLGYVFVFGFMGRVKLKLNLFLILFKFILDELLFVILMFGMIGFEFCFVCLYWEVLERDFFLERFDKGSNLFFIIGMFCFFFIFSCFEFFLLLILLNEFFIF